MVDGSNKGKGGKMKKTVAILCVILTLLFCGCQKGGETETDKYVLNEKSFFLVMTHIQYYPSQYEGKTIEFDCFTYELTDVNGVSYTCGVRKCSAGYGCTCGKDTIIGFILNYSGEIPAPKNQGEDTNDKTWVRLSGTLAGSEFKEIKIYAYSGDEIDYNTVETIKFLTYNVESLNSIEDYSSLNYYVTK